MARQAQVVKQADGSYKKVVVSDDGDESNAPAQSAPAPSNRGAPGKHLVGGKMQTPMETADDVSASNAGSQSQSSDHMNGY